LNGSGTSAGPDAFMWSVSALAFLASSDEPRTTAEIAEALGLSRSSGYRLVKALERDHWVEAEGSPSRYVVTINAWPIGHASLSRRRTRDVVLSQALQLTQTVKKTTVVGLYWQRRVMYTDRVDYIHAGLHTRSMAREWPILSSAGGKAALAFSTDHDRAALLAMHPSRLTIRESTIEELRRELDLVRDRGYAVVDNELVPGASAIAAPVLDESGFATAALAISQHGAITEQFLEAMVEPLLAAAGRASTELGHSAPLPFAT
jgi:DNA-binding IclR family transcriptional regulator